MNRFLDGDLSLDEQPSVFSHLADCAECRRMVTNVLQFRQISRQEHLPVPPTVDEGFFQKLEQHKQQKNRRDRVAERRPLWQTRRLVSLRTAVVAGALLLGLGLLVPSSPAPGVDARFYVSGEAERVEFRDVIYVIYPGVTVEASLEL